MEKNKFLKIVIILLLILNFGTLAFMFIGKQRGNHPLGPPSGHGGPAKFIMDELDFNDTQRKSFEELKREHQGQMRQMEDSMRVQRNLIPDLIVKGDKTKADSVANIIGGYQAQIELYTYEHFVKVYALCENEQKAKFKDIIGEILARMAPGKGGPPRR